jgi:site-specific DNA-methyltransferase (cytosine-N4-specific)
VVIVNAEAGRLPLADGSVDACLTSPPYWGGVREYMGDQAREWPAISYPPMPGLPPVEIPAQAVALGHEPDPFAYVGHLLQVFREVRRVLAPGGCLAVNLGDSYSGSRRGPQGATGERSERWFTRERCSTSQPAEIPAKNLILMPARFALAMQTDGWILRSRMPGGVEVFPGDDVGIEPDIVWRKMAAMPESVRDRPSVDFEDVLIFSTASRYFWDQEAGREESSPAMKRRAGQTRGGSKTRAASTTRKDAESLRGNTGREIAAAGRNMRSVWTINPEPTDEEHFAAWPTALASRLIRVMTSERGKCPTCGAPWVRQVERGPSSHDARKAAGWPKRGNREAQNLARHAYVGGAAPAGTSTGGIGWVAPVATIGWSPSCAHDAAPAPALVLDPFAGLGRTWEAARATGRRFIGTELGLGYCRLALSRNDLQAMERRRNASPARTITGPLFGTGD